ncbi:hypothetical protein ED208_08445 [Stagnimonas aquatica]|uniref:Uncharacterized protein n=1 Tax=Stagnimonas aquatica TaxID=2689987 RepID=A0A3N0VE84_9GAMM|nr:hypothetical protein [Stagnimonas aquatica]ROH90992.1 hypothetical protein ED208_08445 [Stagnimonas aquatica]
MADRPSEDLEDILHWLNAHCVRLSDGVPATLLQQKWQAGRRDPAHLRDGLAQLFAQGQIALTPDLEPPHVRFTASGYARLLEQFDRARRPAPAGTGAEATEPVPATTLPPPALTGAPAELPLAPPQRFLRHGQPPTEIALRNQLLDIYRDLKLKPGSQIIAMTLSRYWQEMGLRAGDLRIAIDVLVRDGYLIYSSLRFEPHWRLTETGHAYVCAPLTPAPLLDLAEPLTQPEAHGLSEEELRRTGLALFRGAASEWRSFEGLESDWRRGRDSLLHSLDLLWKAGLIELRLGMPLALRLTEQGAVLRDKSAGGLRRLIGL